MNYNIADCVGFARFLFLGGASLGPHAREGTADTCHSAIGNVDYSAIFLYFYFSIFLNYYFSTFIFYYIDYIDHFTIFYNIVV